MSRGGSRGTAGGRARPASVRVPWRLVTAALAGLLTYLCSAGGLFLQAPVAFVSVLVGIVVGLVAAGPLEAAFAAAVGALAGVLAMPGFYMDPRMVIGQPPIWSLAFGAATVAGAATAAASVSWARGRLRGRARAGLARRADIALVAGAVLVCVYGMWSTALTIARMPVPGAVRGGMSLVQQLDARPVTGTVMSDDEFFRDVVWRMRELREPYYDAYRTAYRENARWGSDPVFFLSYRLPASYWLLAATPGGGMGMVVEALLFATVGVAASVFVAARRVRLPLAVIASAAVASYFLFLCIQTTVVYAEPRAVALALAAMACAGMADRSARPRAWTVAAVALAVAAALFRELVAFVLVAGLAAAFFAGARRRRFEVAAWGVGLGLVGAALVAHYVAVGGRVAVGGGGFGRYLGLSPGNVVAAIRYGTWYLGGEGWPAFVLAGLGLLGASMAPGRRERVFAFLAVALPLLGFLVFHDAGVDEKGVQMNYWGILVDPLLYALVPWALALLPGAARGPVARADDGESAGAEGEGRTVEGVGSDD